jgi:hypothetical protein
MAKIRIVADYCSTGYQLGDDQARRLGEPPLSEGLAQRLAAWNARFEDRCHPLDYEDVSGSRFDFVAFAAEGLEIARAVKRELPAWTVTYWDEALDWFLARDPRRYDPAQAEYEITLQDAFAHAAPSSARSNGAR